MAGLRRSRVGLSIGAFSIAALTAASMQSAAARSAPALTAPRSTERGRTAALAVSPRGARSCQLMAGGPERRVQRRRIPGGGSYTVYLSIAHDARGGSWTLRLSCDDRRSTAKRLQVLVREGDERQAGSRLFVGVRVGPATGGRRDGLAEPTEGGGRPPAVDLTSDLPGGDRGREARAIEWAKQQVGRSDFQDSSLRFVGYAFGVVRPYPSATIAATALKPRNRTKSASMAPAGSLVWFHRTDPKDGVNYGHVGISLGDGTMISALDTVRVDGIDGSRYWRPRYRGWTPAPASWPGRVGPRPLDAGPASITIPPPPETTPPGTTPPPAPATTPPPPAPPPPPPPPPLTPEVNLTKGASAVGQPNCWTASCAFLHVSFANFDGREHLVVCRASNGDEGGWWTYPWSGSSGTSEVCYYGFPGRAVWVTVDGVSSNQIGW